MLGQVLNRIDAEIRKDVQGADVTARIPRGLSNATARVLGRPMDASLEEGITRENSGRSNCLQAV